MLQSIRIWMTRFWQLPDQHSLMQAYRVTFSTHEGQLVLQHLMDTVYCRVYEGTDTEGTMIHNARRSVIQEMLENIDAAINPNKYAVSLETEIQTQQGDRNGSLV